jgi:hypothetical protein
MRQVLDPQLKLGRQDIGAILLDIHSRDDIPRILRVLQHIYFTPDVRERVFAILAEVLPLGGDGQSVANPDTGRPDTAQWSILVLGVLRLVQRYENPQTVFISSRQRPASVGPAKRFGHGVVEEVDEVGEFLT